MGRWGAGGHSRAAPLGQGAGGGREGRAPSTLQASGCPPQMDFLTPAQGFANKIEKKRKDS